MSKPIVCLDFDGVIHSYTSGWQGANVIADPPVPGAIEFIGTLLIAEFDVVIFSSRSHQFGGIRAMRKWLREHAGNLWYDTPAGSGIEAVRFVKEKPPALVTIDDRAITFTGTWPTAEQIRAFRPWNKNGVHA